MCRANQGFFSAVSQSANTSRGSLLAAISAGVPSGKTGLGGGTGLDFFLDFFLVEPFGSGFSSDGGT